MASEKEITLPRKLADLYYIFSTVGPSDLPRYTTNEYSGCNVPNYICFYPISHTKIYTRVVGEIRSNYPNKHGITCIMWDYVKQEWSDLIGSIQIPANSSDWHSFDYIIPNLTNISEILFYTSVDTTLDTNGKLYYLEGAAITLEKCITLRDDTWNCDPYTSGSCKCGDEGPQQNTFDWQQVMMCYSKIIGDIEGARHAMVFFFDWGDGLYPVWWHEWDPTPWTGYACFWAWPSIGSQFGNGIGVVGIYVDGVYIGQSNQFTITGAPQGAIIDWWRKDPRIGPFALGQQDVLIVGGELKNTGPSGFYYFKFVQNPGTPQENLLYLYGKDLDAGQGMGFGHNLDMPTVAGIYTLGLKIWGDGQNEPSWGSANTLIWDIYVGVVPPCEEYWFQWECEYNGCYWYDGSCHSSLPCSSYSTQSTCEAAGCYWWNNACHDLPPYCSDLNNQTDCELYECHWYNNSCHSEPLPNLCAWIIDQLPGWPSQPVTDVPITSVMEIIESFVLQTPPSGYTFIPTLQNVFGVIDYYLGFDGDEATGCDFFP